MGSTFFRDTWAEINLDAIGYNIEKMTQSLSHNTNIIAVVKANAYGHGAVRIAEVALENGANFLAVGLLEEALSLRKAGIKSDILVFGWVAPENTILAAEENITLTFFQKEWIHKVKEFHFKKNLKLHMKWDTGMGRIGVRTETELEELVEEVKENSQIHLTGVYTHFATADEKGRTYFQEQQSRFANLLTAFRKLWIDPILIHAGNSAAAIRLPDKMYHSIRLGIFMYGLYPSQTIKQEKRIDVKPAFSLHSRLIHVKEVPQGEFISYGATYQTRNREWIGTIPIGYADGWLRKLQGIDVLVDGKRVPIVGRICMDLTMIRLDKEYPIGTKVTLIGRQGNEVIDCDEIANYLDTINYEIPCMIGSRVPRVYTEG